MQHRDGRIVMDREDVGVGELLRVRVARGDFGVRPVSDGITAATATTMPHGRPRRSRAAAHRDAEASSRTTPKKSS